MPSGWITFFVERVADHNGLNLLIFDHVPKVLHHANVVINLRLIKLVNFLWHHQCLVPLGYEDLFAAQCHTCILATDIKAHDTRLVIIFLYLSQLCPQCFMGHIADFRGANHRCREGKSYL